MAGDNNELVSSLISGEVIWDPKGILAEMRKQLTQFEGPLQRTGAVYGIRPFFTYVY